MTKSGKKTKKRSKGRGGKTWLPWAVAGGVLLGGGLVGLTLYSPVPPPAAVPQPAYEEIHSRPQPFQERIAQIDQAVYETLYRCGIQEKDIRFTDVGHRHAAGETWDFTEIQVRVRDERILHEVEARLRERFASMEPEIQCWKEAEPSSEAVYRIYARHRQTHRIRLRIEEASPGVPPRKKQQPRIAIIVDDLGYDRGLACAFADVDLPLCLSVLPMAPRTEDVARVVQARHRELMLHIPMEPKGYPELNPGPGALLNRMNEEEIRTLLSRHLKEVPGATGANNHMGSSFTEHAEQTAVVLEELEREGLFFVDSKTSGHSVAYRLARERGIRTTQRNVFLDNEPSEEAIARQLDRLLSIARHRGTAVGIAHPFPGTLDALRHEASRLKGVVEIVPVSEIAE